jgi:hypothetical protein
MIVMKYCCDERPEGKADEAVAKRLSDPIVSGALLDAS